MAATNTDNSEVEGDQNNSALSTEGLPSTVSEEQPITTDNAAKTVTQELTQEGDNKTVDSTLPLDASHDEADLSGLPEVKYQQGPGEQACLFKCAASAAHYCGFEQTGARANQLSNHNLAPGENWKRLVKAVSSGTSKGHLQPKRLKQSDDVLDVAKTSAFVVVGLVSADGSTTHAVALTDKWIFDANLTHALPLSRESLNICCSSDTGHSEFVRLNRGYSFTMR